MSKKTKIASAIENPSVHAFSGSLIPSYGLLTQGRWDQRTATTSNIPVVSAAMRCEISNRIKDGKKPQSPENANLQTTWSANLASFNDMCVLYYNLSVRGDFFEPCSCNNEAYKQKLCERIAAFSTSNEMKELVNLYAFNIAAGRSAFRNRDRALEIEVQIVSGEQTWKFEPTNWNMNAFTADTNQEALADFQAAFYNALMNKVKATHFGVKVFMKMGNGAKVFPSQELLLDGNKKDECNLFVIENTAGLHSQKIGNAIRTVDCWYNDYEGTPRPISTYGSDTFNGVLYRGNAANNSFYSLLDDWMMKDRTPDSNNMKYLMGMLIRGGVFGKSGKNDSAAPTAGE